jgi:hypothetical protein
MTDRKLASVQKIVNIEAIEGADAIEKATVLGWQVVIAKKDNLQIGDNVVYIEIDSIMPEKPEFEFLRQRKFRVRTIKLRNTISQGLILPLSVLPKGKYSEGADITSLLSVRKYDPQAEIEQRLANEKNARETNKIKKLLNRMSWFRKLFGTKRASFPSFIRKTDEDRIQLFPHICENEKDTIFELTEKVDGQSGTYFLVQTKGWFGKKKFTFGVCSRNLLLPKPDNSSYWTIAKKYNVENVLKALIGNNKYIVLQGEIVGTNIQGNKYGVKEHDFYAFNLIASEVKVGTTAKRYLLDQHGIKCVPLLDTNFRLKPTIAEMVDFSNGKSVLADTLREGIVVRNYEKNISFKVVSPEFLLKHGE